MKQTPDLDRAQQRMMPGELTLHGFLGDDTRKLVDIINEDGDAVLSRGVSHKQIADRLADIMEQGRDIMEREVNVEGRFTVTVRDDRGVLPSPFGDGCFEKGDCHVVDSETKSEFLFNGLTIHMIRTYGFYSGKGSQYRLEPAALIETFGIKPEAEE
ncbi:MAG: hypothetical protein JXR97_16305 [Planctomycetes bacterium]|nr:hypothetical protein [Planctomycetota bacterium]